MKGMITLSGGSQVESYDNTECPVCGREMLHAVACWKLEANVCDVHCGKCRHYQKELQRCSYKKDKEKELLQQQLQGLR